ncbi:unnamed protein product [Rhodiola kirilowii]
MTSMQSPTDTCLTFRHQSRRHHPSQSTPGLFLSLHDASDIQFEPEARSDDLARATNS